MATFQRVFLSHKGPYAEDEKKGFGKEWHLGLALIQVLYDEKVMNVDLETQRFVGWYALATLSFHEPLLPCSVTTSRREQILRILGYILNDHLVRQEWRQWMHKDSSWRYREK